MSILYKSFKKNIRLAFVGSILSLIAFQSANCEIIAEKPLAYVFKVSLDKSISVRKDLRLSMVPQPITLNLIDLVELNILYKRNIKSGVIKGECIPNDSNDRIECKLNTLKLTTNDMSIEKEIKGWIVDKDGIHDFQGEIGIFDKLFSEHPTLTKKKIDGEEFDVVLIFPQID